MLKQPKHPVKANLPFHTQRPNQPPSTTSVSPWI